MCCCFLSIIRNPILIVIKLSHCFDWLLFPCNYKEHPCVISRLGALLRCPWHCLVLQNLHAATTEGGRNNIFGQADRRVLCPTTEPAGVAQGTLYIVWREGKEERCIKSKLYLRLSGVVENLL